MSRVSVKAYDRRKPEKKPDPLSPLMEAKRKAFERRWGIEVINDNDPRLDRPHQYAPGAGRQTLQQIAEQLAGLARLAAKIGRRG